MSQDYSVLPTSLLNLNLNNLNRIQTMLITVTYHEVPCRRSVSLWRSKNIILKCYSAEVAGNSASAKMQNSQMGQFGDYSQ